MRIINNRQLLTSLFASHQLYFFSSTPKKSNPGFQFRPQKQQHQEDAKYFGFTKSSHIETWEINRTNQSQQLDVKNNQAQYLGLRHLQQAFKSRLAQAELTKTRFQSINLSNETKKSNSQKFIKLIGHSLSREGCLQIINLIQVYCEEIRSLSHQKMELIPTSFQTYDSSRKSLAVLFNKIQSILMEDMVQDQKTMEQNTQYANNLMKMLAEADLNSITLKEFEQNSGFFDSFDYHPKEIRNFLNFEYLNQASTFQEPLQLHQQKKSQVKQAETENILQQALKLRQNQKSTKIYVKNQRPRQGVHKEIKIKVAPEQDIFFTKITQRGKDYDNKMMQSKKYAYLYDLPYNVLESQCKELIAHIESTKKVKIISHKLLTYDKYLKLQSKEKTHHVPEYFQVDGFLLKVYEQIDVNMYLDADKNSKNSKGKLKEKPIALSSTTQALLKKIKREKYSMLNRSVLILKFESEQQKKKLVNPELRLYGINFKHLRNVKIQQGFSKTVLKVHGISSGCTTTELNDFLNTVFKPLGFCLQVEKDLYLSKNYILIQFQNFTQVLSAMKLLQNRLFQEKQLKGEIYYGSSKVFKGDFSPSLQNSKERLKQRVVEVSKKYYKKNEEESQF